MSAEGGPAVPSTRAQLRYLLALDLAGHGVDRWRARYRITRPGVHHAWLRRRAQYWAHASDRTRVVRPVVAAVFARRVRHLGPVVDLAPVPRRTTMTAEQVRLARRLCDRGAVDLDAVADAFWVSRSTLLDHLGGDGRRDVTSHAS